MGRPRKWKDDAERKRAERAAALPPDIEIGVGEDAIVEIEAGRTGSVIGHEEPDPEHTTARSRPRARAGVADPPASAADADADRQEPADAPPDPAAGASWEELEAPTVEWDGKLWPVVRRKGPTEEVYVASEALATKLLISQGLKDPDGKRVERAKAHARWRYRGWQAGEIRSL